MPGWILLAFAAGIPPAFFIYHLAFQHWYTGKTRGDRYFALPAARRRQFRQQLQCHARLLLPFYRFLARGVNPKTIPARRVSGICFPAAVTDNNSINNAIHYTPSADDIVVATFMKSGTTWMQNIVFELLHNGEGNLGDNGYRHLYAMSPWLECSPHASVSLERAPAVSPLGKRIIKTHLPAGLCPFGKETRYIYVVRDPTHAFASFEDFFTMLMGPFCPSGDELLELFCSDNMLWGSWPDHVAGWWQMAQQHGNVLFITYEALQADTMAALQAIADFIGLDISTAALQKVADKTSFACMKAHEEQFEMAPPNLFSVASGQHFLQAGSTGNRDRLDAAKREKILAFCRLHLPADSFPFDRHYR